jgi:hypothetical protein
MIANQTSRGLRNAARWIGLLGSSVALSALLAACGGTIEQTDVDQQHLENGNNGKQLSKAAEASSTPAKPAATNNQTAAASSASSTTPAPTPKPAAEPPPAADDDPPAADEDPPASSASADLSFATDIWPIFSASCAPCHSTIGLGGQNIAADDKAKALADAKSFKDGVVSEINSGGMPPSCGKPPGGAGCITADDFADIKAWYAAGSPP